MQGTGRVSGESNYREIGPRTREIGNGSQVISSHQARAVRTHVRVWGEIPPSGTGHQRKLLAIILELGIPNRDKRKT